MVALPRKSLFALLPFFLHHVNAQASGTGTTTRYWDCCKPSCSWPQKAVLAAGSSPVTSCSIHDTPLADANAASGCSSGTAYACSNQSPWAVSNSLSYGYAAVNIAGGSEASWCCACYELTFTGGPVAGKKMIVQATNTGGDLGSNQFDLAIPGGGVGIFNGCTAEFGAPSTGWGAQYGGVSSRSACDAFPPALKPGCYWHWDWFQSADNPPVSFTQVACPAALTARTGCVRADDGSASPSSSQPANLPTYPLTSTGGSNPSPSSSTSTSTSSTTSSTHAPATSPPSSCDEPIVTPVVADSAQGSVAKYDQCGGLNHAGSTTCVAGTTCTLFNPYYSQCL